jgi:hypothetical protein
MVCDTCGASRTTARLVRSGLRLRCDGCGTTTWQTPLDPDNDWRERDNAKMNAALAALERDIDVMRTLNVEVRFVHTSKLDAAADGVDVKQWLDDDGGFLIQIDQDRALSERHDLLRCAWRFLLPSACTSWNQGVSHTQDGTPYIGTQATAGQPRSAHPARMPPPRQSAPLTLTGAPGALRRSPVSEAAGTCLDQDRHTYERADRSGRRYTGARIRLVQSWRQGARATVVLPRRQAQDGRADGPAACRPG